MRVIVPEEPARTVRDPEVDYDGRRIVFSMRKGKMDDYHLYTVNADGTGLAQLTREKGVSDIDPVWLPDGDILFSSTRNPKYCMCNRHIMANLYRMKPDGANIHQIGVSTLFEGHSSVLPDGRIIYDRWEYVDRNFGDAQGLWVCNPDGTRHAIYWGNNTTSPGGVLNARAIDPNDSSKVIAVLGSCHDRPWGALGIIDRAKGVDGKEPVLRTWPASYRDRIHAGGKEDFDSTRGIRLKYADPFPLDAEHFIAVRMTGRGDETALVYLDLHGNEVVFHAEAPGCHSPFVLRPSKKPVVQSEQRTFASPTAPGLFYVQNIYVGTHMKGVAPGSVKAIRVVESPEKHSWTPRRGWFGHGEEAAAMNWHSFENKRILGTVPVEADGSAREGHAPALLQLPARGAARLHRQVRQLPRLRQAGGEQDQPQRRQGRVLLHELRRSLGARLHQMHRRRPGLHPAGVQLGFTRVQAHEEALRTRQGDADGRGARPHHHVDGRQRALLPAVRVRLSRQPRRTHAAHLRGEGAHRKALRARHLQCERSSAARTAQLRPSRVFPHP